VLVRPIFNGILSERLIPLPPWFFFKHRVPPFFRFAPNVRGLCNFHGASSGTLFRRRGQLGSSQGLYLSVFFLFPLALTRFNLSHRPADWYEDTFNASERRQSPMSPFHRPIGCFLRLLKWKTGDTLPPPLSEFGTSPSSSSSSYGASSNKASQVDHLRLGHSSPGLVPPYRGDTGFPPPLFIGS